MITPYHKYKHYMKTPFLITLLSLLFLISISGQKKYTDFPRTTLADTNALILFGNLTTGYLTAIQVKDFLRGTSVTNGNKGDITVSGSGNTWQINSASVANGKLSVMANNTIKGNISGSSSTPQDITITQLMSSMGISIPLNAADTIYLHSLAAGKLSPTSLKTVNGNTLIGSGDITITSSVAWGNILTGGGVTTQTDLISYLNSTYQPVITLGNTAQYFRGDLSVGTFDKAAIGLGNVDNTSDLNKPISAATSFALSQKQTALVSGVNIKTINFQDIIGSGNITIAGSGSGGESLDQTLAIGNTSNRYIGLGTNSPISPIDIVRNPTNLENDQAFAIHITQSTTNSTNLTGIYPYASVININGGNISFEAAGLSSIINQTAGYCYSNEGYGAVITQSGGFSYENRPLSAYAVLNSDSYNSYGTKNLLLQQSDTVQHDLVSSANNVTQISGSVVGGVTAGISSELNLAGSNNTVRGAINYVGVSAGSNVSVYGNDNTIVQTGGYINRLVGEYIDLNLSGGTNSSATALIVNGPNGISGDPTVASFNSRMASSYGIYLVGHSSQSQDLFNIVTGTNYSNMFRVQASGSTSIIPLASSDPALKINARSGHTGLLIDAQYNGSSVFSVSKDAEVKIGSNVGYGDTRLKLLIKDNSASSQSFALTELKTNSDADDINFEGAAIVKHDKNYNLTPGYAGSLQLYGLAGSYGTILGNNSFTGNTLPYTPNSNSEANSYIRFELGPIWPKSEKMRINNSGDILFGTTTIRNYSASQTGFDVIDAVNSFFMSDTSLGIYFAWGNESGGTYAYMDKVQKYISANNIKTERSRSIGSQNGRIVQANAMIDTLGNAYFNTTRTNEITLSQYGQSYYRLYSNNSGLFIEKKGASSPDTLFGLTEFSRVKTGRELEISGTNYSELNFLLNDIKKFDIKTNSTETKLQNYSNAPFRFTTNSIDAQYIRDYEVQMNVPLIINGSSGESPLAQLDVRNSSKNISFYCDNTRSATSTNYGIIFDLSATNTADNRVMHLTSNGSPTDRVIYIPSSSGSDAGDRAIYSLTNASSLFTGNVGIGVDINSDSDVKFQVQYNSDFIKVNKTGNTLLELSSTTKGFLPPRMTATQASAISSPSEGLMVYVTDTNGTFTAKGWWGYDGSTWQKLNN